MLRKEIKRLIHNPVYFIIMSLPLMLSFIMSEGTKSYLSQHLQGAIAVKTVKEVILYDGPLLNSKVQFAVSELNFMLMVCAVLAGLSMFEERKLHVWDRVVCKGRIVLLKFLTHYAFSLIMITFNIIGYRILFDIGFSIKSVGIFLSIPIISISVGLFVGILAYNRAMLSNTILMLVMMMGYFGGALSLTSVLSNTKFMNVLMHVSPLTIANRLIFKDLLHMQWGKDLWTWLCIVLICELILVSLMVRRVKNGSSI